MIEYADRELAALCRDVQSEHMTRKRSGRDRIGIRRNICAFANDLRGSAKPGVIFVGAEAGSTCPGIDVDDRLLRRLARMSSDGAIVPCPRMSVEKKVLDGCKLAVMTVQPSGDTPVRFQGRVWIKVGPTVQQATPQEERHLTDERPWANLPFDHRPSAASIRDLDRTHIERTYLPKAVAEEAVEHDHRTLDDQLRALRLAKADQPTRGALIAFGNDPLYWSPGAYVQFLRRDGTSRRDPITAQTSLQGRLDEVLRQLDQLIRINISERPAISSDPLDARCPDYPSTAVRHVMHNALMHRSYEYTDIPVRFCWYSDRVEIQSPGGLFGVVNSANIDSGETDYRNPLIAEIMQRLGFARKIGLGLQLAKQALAANGNPPLEFDFSPTRVKVTLRSLPCGSLHSRASAVVRDRVLCSST